MKPLRYHPAAREELRAAALIGEDDHPGRGAALEAAVARVERRLRQFPESAPRWREPTGSVTVRKALVKRTPYLLIYVDLSDQLVVLAVTHVRQAPGYWRKRLDELPT